MLGGGVYLHQRGDLLQSISMWIRREGVAFSGGTEGDREHCLDAVRNDYLSKPIQWEELIAVLERVLLSQ